MSYAYFQFQGCYFHACECQRSRMSEKLFNKRQTRTLDKIAYLKSQNYNVEEMWECHFKKLMYFNPKINHSEIIPPFARKYTGEISQKTILEAVKNDELFGAIEVDIQVPERWMNGESKGCSPKEFFSEMSPFFCTTEIGFDEMGEHMQDHVRRCDLSTVSIA